MAGISIWTIIGVIIALVALVVLLFPFVFRIEFRVDLSGGQGRLFLFKKKIYEIEKKFKDDSKDCSRGAEGGKSSDEDDEDFAPSYVPPVKTTATKPESDFSEFDVDDVKPRNEPLKIVSVEEEPIAETADEPAATAAEPAADEKPAGGAGDDEPAAKPEPVEEEKPEKSKKLTETEFWTILLTPEFDASAFWAVRKLLSALLNLFRVKFQDCFVEGIRGDYVNMGYGAALNGILKSFPWVGAWDLRMDWTRDHELCAQGQIRASINLCRILGVVVTVLFYGAILAFKFWRRRARVLKTHELPELGWIRRKIVKMLAEED